MYSSFLLFIDDRSDPSMEILLLSSGDYHSTNLTTMSLLAYDVSHSLCLRCRSSSPFLGSYRNHNGVEPYSPDVGDE